MPRSKFDLHVTTTLTRDEAAYITEVARTATSAGTVAELVRVALNQYLERNHHTIQVRGRFRGRPRKE